jgi:prepilin-type processing-associated H-X9-DG protein
MHDEHLGLGGHGFDDQGRTAKPTRESEIVAPSEMMAIGPGFYGAEGKISVGGAGIGRGQVMVEPDGTKRAYRRHAGKANVVFCDGHTETIRLKTLFVDTTDDALRRWNKDHEPHRDRVSH